MLNHTETRRQGHNHGDRYRGVHIPDLQGDLENSVSECTPYKTFLDFVHIHVRTYMYTTSRSDDSEGEVCWLCGQSQAVCGERKVAITAWERLAQVHSLGLGRHQDAVMESSPLALKEPTDRYAEVYEDSLGTMKSFRAHAQGVHVF